jgi:hypothetical protein
VLSPAFPLQSLNKVATERGKQQTTFLLFPCMFSAGRCRHYPFLPFILASSSDILLPLCVKARRLF